MASLSNLEALVTLVHTDVLEDLNIVMFDERTRPWSSRPQQAEKRLENFLGRSTLDHLYYVTRNVPKTNTWEYKKDFILVISSRSSLPTISDAYEDWTLTHPPVDHGWR